MAENGASIHPHILALPFPVEGHINPLLHLCKRLADLGCNITFLNSERIHTEKFAFSPAIHPLISFVGISDGFSSKPPPGLAGFKQFFDSLDNLSVSFEQYVQDLIEQRIPISCILSDTFLPWSQHVADKFGIPRVALNTCSAAADLLMCFLPRLIEEGHIPVKGESGEIVNDKIVDFIPGMSLKPTDLFVSFFSDGPHIAMIRDGYETLKKAKYVLSSTVEELEAERVKAMREAVLRTQNYFPVGPLLPSSFLGLEDTVPEKDHANMSTSDKKCIAWLDQQQPLSVLYVSFGSSATLSAKQALELFKALEASRLPFLLVMRSTLVADLAQDTYQEFLSSTQHQGLVVDWCPQMRVLAHPSTGGFLTHCGWNSTMESICAGVPMVGWPCTAEQNFNIKFMVEDWGIAISLWKGEKDRFVERGEIGEAIEKLMKGDEGKMLRERVLKLQEAARKGVVEGGSSYTNLCHFASAITY